MGSWSIGSWSIGSWFRESWSRERTPVITPTTSGAVKKVWLWFKPFASSILCLDGDPVPPVWVKIYDFHHGILRGIHYRDCHLVYTSVIKVHDRGTVGDPIGGDWGIVGFWCMPVKSCSPQAEIYWSHCAVVHLTRRSWREEKEEGINNILVWSNLSVVTSCLYGLVHVLGIRMRNTMASWAARAKRYINYV